MGMTVAAFASEVSDVCEACNWDSLVAVEFDRENDLVVDGILDCLEYFSQLFPDRDILSITEVPLIPSLIPDELLAEMMSRANHCGLGWHRIERTQISRNICTDRVLPAHVCERRIFINITICNGCNVIVYMSSAMQVVDVGHPWGICAMRCGVGVFEGNL